MMVGGTAISKSNTPKRSRTEDIRVLLQILLLILQQRHLFPYYNERKDFIHQQMSGQG